MLREMKLPTIHAIRAASDRLEPHLLPTPFERSAWLSERAGTDVLVKWESQQRTGSFKLRGALHKLLELSDRGVDSVLAVSAGNHGLGLAHAARIVGMSATVVVPESAAKNKVAAIKALGAELVVRGADYDAAEVAARALAEERGVEFVSPYNDFDIVVGQATLALEMFETPGAKFDRLVVPTGGGGLLAGAIAAARGLSSAVTILGAQPEHAPAMFEALRRGTIGPVEESPTCADGLAGNLERGSITFDWIRDAQTRVVLTSEASIEAAMRECVERDH